MILLTFDATIHPILKIVLLEPFFAGSHKSWAENYQKHSQHDVFILSMKGRHWKWRMYGGAVSLAKAFLEKDIQPDLILATDMLDLSTFLGLTRSKTANIPVAIYFHENQITYPWSPEDADIALKRNNQYGFLNYTSALAADAVFFNSAYHKSSFLNALPIFLKQFPDYRDLQTIPSIEQKSSVLYLGMDLKRFDRHFDIPGKEKNDDCPLILWNHRWEYDKNPDLFFQTLFRIKEDGINFKLAVLGESYQKQPAIFNEAKNRLANEIVKFGYADSFEDYASWLWAAQIYPVSSNQDFFGGSVVEAIYCNCFPILPKRLAYPEHIPESFHKTHFFEKDDVFYTMLKDQIINFVPQQEASYCRDFVARYDWSNLAPLYDQRFATLTKFHAKH